MFDAHARALIASIADIPTMDRDSVRRLLSTAYVEIIRRRGGASAADGRSRASIVAELRRLAAALESAAVFDDSLPTPPNPDVCAASAFVSAEALALAADLLEEPEAGIKTLATYERVEAAMLYLIGGYDINAVSVVQPAADAAINDDPLSWFLHAIAKFCRGDVSAAYPVGESQSPRDVVAVTRHAVAAEGIAALNAFREWLVGVASHGPQAAIDRLSRVCELLRRSSVKRLVPELSDLFHVASLLRAALNSTRERALVSRVPAPNGSATYSAQFTAYLKRRAGGDPLQGLRARPFLWPSTLEFVEQCLPGPHKDAVVTMPTGSGKSFLAELAVAHALSRGWVLYLAPTNALAHQVRRDLANALRPFQKVPVIAMIGGPEYSSLVDQTEFDRDQPFVAVMTPEKAALAIRTTPDLFERCALCIFDECHLLNDRSGRGALAELVMAHIFGAAPDARLLLQSAMVQNGEELARWIENATGRSASPSTIKWRPSRTARGFVIVNRSDYNRAEADSQTPPEGRGPFRASAGLGLVVGLSGPWSLDGAEDYRMLRLPLKIGLKRSRKRTGGMGPFGLEDSSWKNGTGARLSAWLAASGLPTINFILSSKHHAFSAASRVEEPLPGALSEGYPEIVEAWLRLARAELGVESALRELFRRGIAIHTAALLQVEQAASEYMFTRGHTALIFATGTLAQGLNLPSNAVVVSGSKVGDPRDMDAAAGLVRANELILNGFGRAGRPGFSNQCLVVLVSDSHYIGELTASTDPRSVLDKSEYQVLQEEDASVAVTSSLESLLDAIVAGGPPLSVFGESGFAMLSYLSETGGDQLGVILRRTFGGFRKKEQIDRVGLEIVSERMEAARSLFLDQENVPSWLGTAAGVAGVDFQRALRLWQAMERTPGVVAGTGGPTRGVLEWLSILVEVLSVLTPRHAGQYCAEAKYDQTRRMLHIVREEMGSGDDDPAWTPPSAWRSAWSKLGQLARDFMSGASFRDFGAEYLGLDPKEITSDRGTRGRVPQILKAVGEIVEWGFAVDAGCFVALIEAHLRSSRPGATVPRSLAILPLCLRYGCDSDAVLAWFRYGYRQRIAAHALARRFPVHEVERNDEALRSAVRARRKTWLSSEGHDDGELLAAARVVLGAEH